MKIPYRQRRVQSCAAHALTAYFATAIISACAYADGVRTVMLSGSEAPGTPLIQGAVFFGRGSQQGREYESFVVRGFHSPANLVFHSLISDTSGVNWARGVYLLSGSGIRQFDGRNDIDLAAHNTKGDFLLPLDSTANGGFFRVLAGMPSEILSTREDTRIVTDGRTFELNDTVTGGIDASGAAIYLAEVAEPNNVGRRRAIVEVRPDGAARVLFEKSQAMQAPGLSPGTVFELVEDIVVGQDGRVAIRARVRGLGLAGVTGLWWGTLDDLRLIALEGNAAVGLRSELTLGLFSPTLGITDNGGTFWFVADVLGPGFSDQPGNGLWLVDEHGVRLVATNVNIGAQNVGVLNDGSYWEHTAVGGPVLEYTSKGRRSTIVSRDPVPAPGMRGPFSSIMAFAFNNRGDVVIWADAADDDPATSTFERTFGIWGGSADGLTLLVREGDQIEVAPGERRRVKASGEGQFEVRVSGLSLFPELTEEGDFCFTARFDAVRGVRDETDGIFTMRTTRSSGGNEVANPPTDPGPDPDSPVDPNAPNGPALPSVTAGLCPAAALGMISLGLLPLWCRRRSR